MSEKEIEKRSGCSKPVFLFLLIAAIIVIAFLIVGLVNTCSAEHEDKDGITNGENIGLIMNQSTVSLIG